MGFLITFAPIMFTENFKDHFKKTILLAWPVCLSNLGNVMVGVVDIIMVGRIGERTFGYSATTAQAAVSLANGFCFLILIFGMGVSYGVTPLVAAADSSGNVNEHKKLLSSALVVNVITNVALFLLLFAISPMINFIHQPNDVVVLAIPFLNVMMLGMLPLAVFATLKQFTEGLSFTRVAMYITIGSNVLNVLFNYILIYGKFGFSAMGVMGSCWASFYARMIMAVAMFLYVYFGKHFTQYKEAFLFKSVSIERMKSIFKIGASSGLQLVFEIGAFSVAMVMIGWIGKREQAAHQIALQVAAMTYLIASGIGSAATVRVGNQLGIKNFVGLREAAYSAFIIIIASQLFFAFLFVVFRFFIPTIFNQDPDVQAIVASLFLIAAWFQLSDGIQVVGIGVLRGVKDVTIPTLLTLIAYWLIGLPCCYLLAFVFGFGIQGVWYGLTIALTLAAIFLFLRFNYVLKNFREDKW